MKIRHPNTSKLWWVVDNNGYNIVCACTPKEARRKARQWWMYLTAPNEELASKYLTGEIKIK